MKRTSQQHEAQSPAQPGTSAATADLASISVVSALAVLNVSPEAGLTQAEVALRRLEQGYNEVADLAARVV